MKPEEIMIGDWVNVNRAENVAEGRYIEWQEIGMVVAISECFVSVRYGDDEFDWEEVSMDAVEPIPITPEILEKNGFVGKPYAFYKNDEHSWLEYYYHEHMLQKWWKGVDEWNNHAEVAEISFQCQCHFVHELQNALRLCKIKKEIEL